VNASSSLKSTLYMTVVETPTINDKNDFVSW
jgi:hypothetical protein